MRVLSLFSGAGGADLGLELAGFTLAGLCEIEPHARAVLRHHWPDVPLHGDVQELDGTAYRGIGLICGGSPCQDLSIAGKRAGMTEGSGTRSSLFFDQVRIWRESQAPYCLWENVLGAFSSNAGRDFAAVLSAFVGADVPVPFRNGRHGKRGWPRAGVVSGPAGVAAWRVLDCQYFGPPQRRRRVFVLGARTGGVDPAEVLALAEGVRGDPPPRREAGEGAAADAGGGAGGAGVITFVERGRDDGRSLETRADGVINTLMTPNGGQEVGAQTRGVVLPIGEVTARQSLNAHGSSVMIGDEGDPMFTLSSKQHGVLAFRTDQEPEVTPGGICHTLDTGSKSGGGQTPAVLAYDMTQVTSKANRSNPQPGDPCHPLPSAGHAPLAVTFKPSHYTRDKDGAPSEIAAPLSADADRGDQEQGVLAYANRGREGGAQLEPSAIAPSLRTPGGGSSQAIVLRNREGKPEVAPTLIDGGRSHGAGDSYDNTPVVVMGTAQANAGIVSDGSPSLTATHDGPPIAFPSTGIPRRLMPIECERLMGWPDNHTAIGVNEKGERYELSDTARYRLCGNGIASPVIAWIAFRLRALVPTPQRREE